MNISTKIRLLVVCICAMTCSVNLFAQKTNTLHLLQKEWTLQLSQEWRSTFKIIFTQDKWKDIVTGPKKTITDEAKYYLSDSPDSIFHAEKVGKCYTGRYIIVLKQAKHLDGTYYKKVDDFKIIKLTDTDLELRHLGSGTIVQCKCK